MPYSVWVGGKKAVLQRQLFNGTHLSIPDVTIVVDTRVDLDTDVHNYWEQDTHMVTGVNSY